MNANKESANFNSGPRSMTGFGRAEGGWRGARASVEIRSVNHRYLDLKIRLPRDLSFIEQRVSDYIRSRVARGRVELSLTISGAPEGALLPVLNLPLAHKFITFYMQLREEMGEAAPLEPGLILTMRDVILWEEGAKDPDAEWEALKPVFKSALDALLESSHAEGARLASDIRERVERLGKLIETVENAQPGEIEAYRGRLAERIKTLAGKADVSQDRLAQEMAIYADRCDCTEEMVRLQAHRERFADVLERGGQMGRELDFLVQEMNREVNTASSKSLSVEVSHAAVDAKSEIEKIREQIQNLE